MNPQRPYPFGPLRGVAPVSARRLAEKIGVSRRTVCRWQRHGLTEAQADQAACALGTHPALVWPEWLQ